MKRRNLLTGGPTAILFPWLPRALGADPVRSSTTNRSSRATLDPPAERGAGTPQSPITNRWGLARYTKLDLEEICIFRGRVGAAYNHHPQMLFAVSENDGKTWSEEAQITPPPIEKTSTYTAEGIRSHEGKLIAYYGHYG